MSTPRPLPARPNLEFERKQAKHLLRDLKSADAEALARTSVLPLARRRRADWKLADAQLIVAREFGFASWPQLVRYFETWARHEASGPPSATYQTDYYEQRVRHHIALHQRRLPGGAQPLAAFVPRLIGKSNDEIFATAITDDEVRLAVARMARFPSWEELMRSVPADPRADFEAFRHSPFGDALDAIRAGDLAALQTITAEHPEMLVPEWRGYQQSTLLHNAWNHQQRLPGPAADAIVAWLESHGLASPAMLTEQLNRIWLNASLAQVRYFLDRGADPTWVPPNGVTLLERALMVCQDPAPVDLIASLVPRPDAFWVHAGLGDTAVMRRFLGPRGTLTAEAHEHRPDFLAVNLPIPMRPEADDAEVMWEAFLIAGYNQRAGSLDLLLEHGVDIDAAPWGQPLLNHAVSARLVRLVELLVERGANRDLKGFMPTMTARELAAEQYQGEPLDGALARLRELMA